MNKIKLIIADPDRQFTDYIANILKLYPEIDLLCIETNGASALQAARQHKPDALLFDLLLPGMDGISLLRSVNEFKNPPATICCTRFYSDVAMEAMRIFGASYILYKPAEGKSLCSTVISTTHLYHRMQCAPLAAIDGKTDEDSMRIRIRNYIVALGINAKLIGCSHLTEAIFAALDDITLTQNLSRGLYHEIASKMQTTSSCVERSIRNAISTAYYSRKLPESFICCPSNKEFIKYILQNIAF